MVWALAITALPLNHSNDSRKHFGDIYHDTAILLYCCVSVLWKWNFDRWWNKKNLLLISCMKSCFCQQNKLPVLCSVSILQYYFFIMDNTTKLHPCRHCLHTRTWTRIWTTSLFLDANTASMPDIGVMYNMFCNPWLENWDVGTIHTGGTRISVTDHMTLSSAKLNLIWTAVVNSRAMTGESQTQSRTIASVHPLYYFATNTDSFSQ